MRDDGYGDTLVFGIMLLDAIWIKRRERKKWVETRTRCNALHQTVYLNCWNRWMCTQWKRSSLKARQSEPFSMHCFCLWTLFLQLARSLALPLKVHEKKVPRWKQKHGGLLHYAFLCICISIWNEKKAPLAAANTSEIDNMTFHSKVQRNEEKLESIKQTALFQLLWQTNLWFHFFYWFPDADKYKLLHNLHQMRKKSVLQSIKGSEKEIFLRTMIWNSIFLRRSYRS